MASENTTEIFAGGAVLAIAIAFLVYAAGATGLTQTTGGGYDLHASFRSIEGISPGADVKLAGVKVGRITSITLDPKTYRADTTIQMNKGIVLPTDSAILISQDGLLGGSYVEIVPGGSLDNLKPGGEITDTQGSVSLISLLMKFVGGDSSGSSSGGAKAGAGSDDPASLGGGSVGGSDGTASGGASK
ncbi:outer membrane lipid asymmetry maintenance protein MlaD [Acidimangrovimonas sediminis]|uniref:outer membrane lipid asymmetry maintenance protein MlaD n=1 Tax=Acidimangrovimonas sediminis TaxID=2056283 RepID=UPI000C80AB58